MWWRPIRGYVSNQLQIIHERDNAHPVVRGLARGDIRAGGSVDELIAAHPPKRVTRHGRFVDVYYTNGPDLIAVDGKLVFAKYGWCSHSTVYFNWFTPADAQEYELSATADCDRRLEEGMNSHRALAGVAGYKAFGLTGSELDVPPPTDDAP